VKTASPGDTVRVHYVGKTSEGAVFDSSEGSDPFEFTLGTKAVIPGFEDAILGMKVGDTKTISIPPDQAYGPHLDDAIVEMERARLPADPEPQPGMTYKGQTPNGPITFVLVSVDDTTVTLDGNHPLAGKELHFDLTLVAIQ
jgi:peptidylprolyl isomerase